MERAPLPSSPAATPAAPAERAATNAAPRASHSKGRLGEHVATNEPQPEIINHIL